MSPLVVGELSELSISALTVGDLVDDLARYVRPGPLGQLNRLLNTVSSTATTIPFEFTDQAAYPGTWIGLGLEVMHVWSYDAAAKVATVQRGMAGSFATEHPGGSLIEIHPRFTRFDLARNLQLELQSWPSSVYAVGTADLSITSSNRAFDLALPDFHNVLEVVVARQNSGGDIPLRPQRWNVVRAQDVEQFPSGVGLVFDDPLVATGAVRVAYSKPFATSGWREDTTLAAVGIRASMQDLPVIGAAARLMLSREIPRSDMQAQGQSRTAEEVPPDSMLRAARELERRLDKGLAREARRLREVYPYREG